MIEYLLFWLVIYHSLLAYSAVEENCYVTEIDDGEDISKNKLLCFGNTQNLAYNATLMANVTEILLFKSEATVMSTDFFKSFLHHSVRTLSISHGNLSSVEESDLNTLSELKHLNLSFNKIENVSERAFANNFKLISISFMANEIKELKRNTFRTLVNLESIDLTRNRLENLDRHLFADNINLVTMEVKFNCLTEISNTMFHVLPMLRIADFSYNKIEAIPPHVFKYNYALKRLNLQGNRIKTLDFGLTHLGLEELNLIGNPLDTKNVKNQQVLKELRRDQVEVKVNQYVDKDKQQHNSGRKLDNFVEDEADAHVTFRLSPGTQFVLGVILILLVAILSVLSLLLYYVQKRKNRQLHKKYYPRKSRSKEHLEEYEESYLQMSVSERSVTFHKTDQDTVENHQESCSCSICFDRVMNNVNVT